MTLSPEQRSAVEAQGQDVCVVAGPGSGKTRVLTHRFEWLVERGVEPQRILAITFTEKAATEIKKRLVDTFQSRPAVRRLIERAYVSTVHGFCARLLREHAITAGVDPEFSVLDENAAAAIRAKVIEEVLDELCRGRPAEMRSLLENLYVSSQPGTKQPDLSVALDEIYEAMRIAGVPPAEARSMEGERPPGNLSTVTAPLAAVLHGAAGATEPQRRQLGLLREWLARAPTDTAPGPDHFEWLAAFPGNLRGLPPAVRDVVRELREEGIPAVESSLISAANVPLYDFLIEILEAIDSNYSYSKLVSGGLDFNDLEERAISLLRDDPATREQIASCFDHILMDELQDTNPLQWTLIELLRRPRAFFAVGDINQSIFGFRHAEPRVFRRYRSSLSDAGNRVHELRGNHRSRGEILAAVNAVFRSVEGVEPHTLVPEAEYPPKTEPSVEVLVAAGANLEEALRREAEWIAARILELKSGLRLGKRGAEREPRFADFAVLGRSLNALEPVREALEAAGIPSLLAGGRTFYESREVRDITQWLAVLVNPRDEVSLAGVLRSPLAGVSDETLLRLRLSCGGNLAVALDKLDESGLPGLDAGDLERLLSFRRRLAGLRCLQDSLSPDLLAVRALDECDYFAGLTAHERSNIEKFLTLLREAWETRPMALAGRLEELAWLRAAGTEPEAPPDDSDAVHLMTIHRSKGLEYPVVFVPALHRQPDRRKPAICFGRESGLGVRWRFPAGSRAIADVSHRKYTAETAARENAEENRLLYVAMTRAEEHLALSWSTSGKDASAWGKLVQQGLEFDMDALGPEPVLHRPFSAAFSVRLMRADRDPDRRRAGPVAAGREPEILAPAAGHGGHESSVPVTAVAAFAECPRNYYLSNFLGAPSAAAVWLDEEDGPEPGGRGADEPDAGEFGRQVHALLAGEAVPEAGIEARNLAGAFAQTPIGARAARAGRVEREFDFVLAVEEVVLRGQIDLWFEEAGELVVVDYKTDRLEDGRRERLDRYALQVRLYALALERYLGRRPDLGLLHLLRTGESIEVDLTGPAIDRAVGVLRDLKRAQTEWRFPPREGARCERCRFRRRECQSEPAPG